MTSIATKNLDFSDAQLKLAGAYFEMLHPEAPGNFRTSYDLPGQSIYYASRSCERVLATLSKRHFTVIYNMRGGGLDAAAKAIAEQFLEVNGKFSQMCIKVGLLPLRVKLICLSADDTENQFLIPPNFSAEYDQTPQNSALHSATYSYPEFGDEPSLAYTSDIDD